MKNKKDNESVSSEIVCSTLRVQNLMTVILPLEMRWEPKEDITAYELSKCLPYLLRSHGTMPYEVDKSEAHFRHFKITDHNH